MDYTPKRQDDTNKNEKALKYNVSVVIPVYNAEKYINKCIDSIINQTLDDIEIILIDDGSTDGSGVICDDYSKIHSNIVVKHITNGGRMTLPPFSLSFYARSSATATSFTLVPVGPVMIRPPDFSSA